MVVLLLFIPVAVVGLDRTFYEVPDDVGVVTMCAIIYIPDIICPIQFAFNVTLSTSDESAGIHIKGAM